MLTAMQTPPFFLALCFRFLLFNKAALDIAIQGGFAGLFGCSPCFT